MKRTTVAKWLEKQKRWQIKVQKDGERRTFTCSKPGRAGQRECHAKADAWLDDNITDTNVRIERLYNDYVDKLKLTTSKSNWRKAESYGKNWILPIIGRRKICDITEANLQNIIDKAYSKGLSKKSLLNIRATITGFLKYCRSRRATTLFPETLTIPKGAKTLPKHILQPEHLAILFQSDQTIIRGVRVIDPLIYAYRFQVLTGLRPGELLGLRWSDIKGSEVFIARSINQFNEITTGKNENAIRHFFMTDTAAEVLQKQRQISDTESIFGEVDQKTYRRYFQRYCEVNNIPKMTPYEMRHTFVSIAKNLSEGQVRSIVGHSKNMDTFGVYGHEIKGEMQKTATEINHLFSEILKAE